MGEGEVQHGTLRKYGSVEQIFETQARSAVTLGPGFLDPNDSKPEKHQKNLYQLKNLVCNIVLASDVIIMLVTWAGLYFTYIGWGSTTYLQYGSATVIFTCVSIFVFKYRNLYEFNTLLSWPSRNRDLILSIAFIALVVVGFGFSLQIALDFSRVWFFGGCIIIIFLITIGRGLASIFIRRLALQGDLVCNFAVFGAGRQAEHLISRLNKSEWPWQRVVGIFDDRTTRIDSSVLGVPVLGDLSRLIGFIKTGRIQDLIIALPWSADDRVINMIRILRELPVNIYLGQDQVSYEFPNQKRAFLNGVPVIQIESVPISGWGGLIKLMEDKILSFLLLLGLSPVMLLIALAIRFDSPGPIIFRQSRYGFNNTLFEVWKFRTMYHHLRDEHGDTSTTRNDARITKVGAFLRRSSLDELPQLFNVLFGNMSIVGPRPHATKSKAAGRLFEEVVAEYAVRHKVKPGMTGWAQVNGWRGETPNEEDIQKRIEHDLYYIENWSVWFDFKILVLSLFIGWTGKKAY